ncbi:hypothetical protein M3685_12420 [Heyndrickxia oleronia]|uniref:Uncharacterized protein n=1 Tax=Heyndrickxia oleronia TaxID=38875 RepID=A0A8E2LCK3_9BACI|nr:hypothetical protein [Heyndrickxia oleronia]OJH17063.1 hypothetical protein BLX88_20315 [Bacillus obstructivus]MCM3454727.1 hypothetical protein [Heyndrickxia oleronia]MEC1373799.1 hypothetical protein [Heyndrickxia oleronia]OOP66278.1 hypothetical protein BWZ43_21830 [Heyndrickxia oleronia]QQZ05387.1 hypothetical protein I5818_02315 [Heyndrickxia oleronia]
MNLDELCCDLHPSLINKLNATMRKKLSNVHPNDKNDLQQELCIKIFEKSQKIEFRDNPPKFWSFFKETP